MPDIDLGSTVKANGMHYSTAALIHLLWLVRNLYSYSYLISFCTRRMLTRMYSTSTKAITCLPSLPRPFVCRDPARWRTLPAPVQPARSSLEIDTALSTNTSRLSTGERHGHEQRDCKRVFFERGISNPFQFSWI